MTQDIFDKFAALIRQECDALLTHWRNQVKRLPSCQRLDNPTLNDHIPLLIEELAVAIQSKSDRTIADALLEGSPPAHGLQRVEDGFDIEEVVAEYNILRECIHELAIRHEVSLQGALLHIINRVLDGAIGLAVQTFATRQALEVQRRREDYLAFVAHDLRTPLNAISLAVRVLEVQYPAQGAGTDTAPMLKSLRRNVKQLEALVGKVMEENINLQTEIGIKLQLREFDLWPLVEALIHDIRPVAGTGSTKLVNEVPEELVVHADASLLRRVFQNLIANAIKYTPHGQISIGAKVANGKAVDCWVSDTGAGIPGEQLEKIFDKGETDQENVGGAGLGLAIVKAFVEAHGGTVHAESTPGMGSTFRFSLSG